MRFKVLGALAVALLADVVPASAQMITQSQIDKKRVKDRTRMLKLTAEHFAKSATLKDDDLETIATIDTERGFRTPAGLFDIAGSDIFLRAHITKATGAVTYQAYEASWYTATQFRDYHSANFEAVEGVGTATLTKISARLGECGPHSEAIGCVRIEHSAFTVSETLLRQIAMRPADKFWRIKFRAQAGSDWEENIAPAEVAGLLAAVDAYVTKIAK